MDIRSVNGVATTPTETPEAIGKTIRLNADALSLDGLGCDEWNIETIASPMNMWDPLLADVLLGPADDKVLDWDKRTLNGWSYVCEGERFLEFLEVDSRVLVISWANGSLNLIAEKALKPKQIEQIQKTLIDAKLYSSDPSGVLDKETQDAISRWAEGHMSSDAPYRFFRTTITENLLHLMGVSDE